MAKKLKQDPNRERFMRENNDQLFQIELDALQKNQQQFKDLVVNAVNSDEKSIYEEILEEFTSEKITTYVNKRVKFLRTK